MSKVKILFLSANPADKAFLSLKEECKEIKINIQSAPYENLLEIIVEQAIRPQDLKDSLLKHQPDIVHFSGHGSRNETIILLDDNGESKPVSKEALKDLFETFRKNIRIVILNACYSRPQAEEIAEIVGCAIGINRKIEDKVAIKFAASFYQGIAHGFSVKRAFDFGKIFLEKEDIPEIEKNLVLLTGENINSSQIYLLKQQHKTYWLLARPDLWDSYVIILEFAKNVHHIFQTLDIQHLNDFISKLDGIYKSDSLGKIHSFCTSWKNYLNEYNKFINEFFSRSGLTRKKFFIIEAFNTLQSIENQAVQKTLDEANKKYYEIIEQRLTQYSAIHDEASKLAQPESLVKILRNKESAMDFSSKIFRLLQTARSLTVDSDNLLRRLIEVLLQE